MAWKKVSKWVGSSDWKIIKNQGGGHDEVTSKIYLKPSFQSNIILNSGSFSLDFTISKTKSNLFLIHKHPHPPIIFYQETLCTGTSCFRRYCGVSKYCKFLAKKAMPLEIPSWPSRTQGFAGGFPAWGGLFLKIAVFFKSFDLTLM